MSYLKLADDVSENVISKYAEAVDREQAFPQQSMTALAQSGLLGLIAAKDVGGQGESMSAAAEVVERIARECGSTAMILCMHYCGSVVMEKFGPVEVRKRAATGGELLTLAFSEAGSRSHFWAPLSKAEMKADGVHLHAKKSWVTSAHHASYVWSSKPLKAEGPSTLWYVPNGTQGLEIAGRFDGLGLRGNDSSPVMATDVVIPEANRLGADGAGFGIMMETVLPLFNACIAAVSIGLMTTAVSRTAAHVTGTTYEHLSTNLAELPTIRNYLARMQCHTDACRCLWRDTLTALTTGRPDAMLRVLQTKAHAGETATEVLDLAMRICGGMAFRKDVGLERYFRDARATGVMAPTTDVLYDFIGKAVCGMELF